MRNDSRRFLSYGTSHFRCLVVLDRFDLMGKQLRQKDWYSAYGCITPCIPTNYIFMSYEHTLYHLNSMNALIFQIFDLCLKSTNIRQTFVFDHCTSHTCLHKEACITCLGSSIRLISHCTHVHVSNKYLVDSHYCYLLHPEKIIVNMRS